MTTREQLGRLRHDAYRDDAALQTLVGAAMETACKESATLRDWWIGCTARFIEDNMGGEA